MGNLSHGRRLLPEERPWDTVKTNEIKEICPATATWKGDQVRQQAPPEESLDRNVSLELEKSCQSPSIKAPAGLSPSCCFTWVLTVVINKIN